MKIFQDKVVAITGAGSGIGQALAIQFAKEKAKLALNDSNAKTLAATIQQLPKETKVYQAIFDVSKKEEVLQFAQNVNTEFGKVDILINNAGVAISKLRTDEVSIEEYEWIVGVNMWGVIYGTHSFLPFLRKQKESAIVNMSSAFAFHGIPFQTGYCCTKFAVRGFTESLELEERFLKTGVSVSCVLPGPIKTNLNKNALKAADYPEVTADFEKLMKMTPAEGAAIIIKGIRKKKARILVGTEAKAFFILNKFPKIFVQTLLHQAFKRFN